MTHWSNAAEKVFSCQALPLPLSSPVPSEYHDRGDKTIKLKELHVRRPHSCPTRTPPVGHAAWRPVGLSRRDPQNSHRNTGLYCNQKCPVPRLTPITYKLGCQSGRERHSTSSKRCRMLWEEGEPQRVHKGTSPSQGYPKRGVTHRWGAECSLPAGKHPWTESRSGPRGESCRLQHPCAPGARAQPGSPAPLLSSPARRAAGQRRLREPRL